MSEEVFQEQIKALRESIKSDKRKLEGAVKRAKEKTQELSHFFAKKDDYPEFDNPQNFRDALVELSEEIGNAAYVVLEIENIRVGVSKALEEPKPVTTPSPSVIVSNPSPVVQAPGGIWGGYLGPKAVKGIERDIEKMKLEVQTRTSKITTEERVTDLLAYGRDLIPEAINRTLKGFWAFSAQARLFPAKRALLHEDLGIHCTKLCGIIRSFCRTASEYRKKDLTRLEMELAKGMTQAIVARYVGESKLSISDLYRAARETHGPTEV